jgi:choline dehydrogenase-like flavoprotein
MRRMILRSSDVTAGDQLEADVCVIGGGPAGIAVASELDGSSLSVCLLESGGIDFDRRADALNELSAGSGDFETPNGTRRRQFGGSSNMWQVRLRRMSTGARYLPLSPSDFEEREWVPNSGWPFSATISSRTTGAPTRCVVSASMTTIRCTGRTIIR